VAAITTLGQIGMTATHPQNLYQIQLAELTLSVANGLAAQTRPASARRECVPAEVAQQLRAWLRVSAEVAGPDDALRYP